MNRKSFFGMMIAVAAGALLPSPEARAGSAARTSERFDRMWSSFGLYRNGTPGLFEQDDWAEKSLLRAVSREMEVLRRDILRELGPGGREAGR